MTLSRKGTVRMVERLVRDRTPAAVVRFGEGEGRILAADPADDLSIRVARRKLSKQTGLVFSPDEIGKVRKLLLDALDGADILGLRGSSRFSAEHRQWMARIGEIYTERANVRSRSAYVAHCLLHHDLYEALPRLLADERPLSVVSCRDVRATLSEDYGTPDVAVYQVPSQYVMRDVDGEYEGRLHDTPIWPDFYRDLRSDLTVREPGEVFLVGAGLFGKDLCIHIRSLGGIALDMGSILDKMAKKVTRGQNRPLFRPLPKAPKRV